MYSNTPILQTPVVGRAPLRAMLDASQIVPVAGNGFMPLSSMRTRRYHGPMIKTAYLRVYQPIEMFPPAERRSWERSAGERVAADERVVKRWLLRSSLDVGGSGPSHIGGAFVREAGGSVLVCPGRTPLRVLAGLLAFRDSVPEEIADAFVPEEEARPAAPQLAELGETHPEVR